jgi:hypothetical protein
MEAPTTRSVGKIIADECIQQYSKELHSHIDKLITTICAAVGQLRLQLRPLDENTEALLKQHINEALSEGVMLTPSFSLSRLGCIMAYLATCGFAPSFQLSPK